jgi:hypothetical protein
MLDKGFQYIHFTYTNLQLLLKWYLSTSKQISHWSKKFGDTEICFVWFQEYHSGLSSVESIIIIVDFSFQVSSLIKSACIQIQGTWWPQFSTDYPFTENSLYIWHWILCDLCWNAVLPRILVTLFSLTVQHYNIVRYKSKHCSQLGGHKNKREIIQRNDLYNVSIFYLCLISPDMNVHGCYLWEFNWTLDIIINRCCNIR